MNFNDQHQVQSDKINKIYQLINIDLIEIKNLFESIESHGILKKLDLSDEDLQAIGIECEQRKYRRKRGFVLSKEEILKAKEHCETPSACSKYLRVTYERYKETAKMYGLFELVMSSKSRLDKQKTYVSADIGKFSLKNILSGKCPTYSTELFKKRFLKYQIKKMECERCGFSKNRSKDGQYPFIVNFKDGNIKNFLLENIEIVCYNCMFLYGSNKFKTGPKIN